MSSEGSRQATPPPTSSQPTKPSAEDEPELTAGDKLGRYELLGKLGAGGMSVVYLAYDPELDRKVALKLMRTHAVGAEGARRLQREAQALAKLSHPNVVPVYDVGAASGQVFVAMEHVEGRTLRAWMNEPREWREVLAVMLDAGRGLAAAHAAGLVHRDFKPDNVLIGNDGRVRVLDFGLARLASVLDGTEPASRPSLPPDSSGRVSMPPVAPSSSGALVALTRADQLVGTPAYMAPEQIRRDTIDERSDQFAFAVTLYEALFKKRPFADPDPEPVGSAVATVTTDVTSMPRLTAPRPPGRTPVPRWIQRAIVRALAYDASQRFPTMNALLDALANDPWRPWRRGALAFGVIAAAVAIGVGVSRSATRDTPRAPICKGGASRVSSVWSETAKEQVESAFTATKLPYAGAAFATVSKELDAYAKAWSDAADDACAATRLRGEQSEEVLDLRNACMTTRLGELRALVDAYAHADADTVKQAAKAARDLPSLADCADIAALRSPSPRPRDAETAAKVDAIESRLAVVQADIAIGKDKDALELSNALLPDARAVGFQPLVARVQLWRARAAAYQNEAKISIPAFEDAFAIALACREERVLKDAAARLAQEYIYSYDNERFETWQRLAQAAIDRGSPDPVLQTFLDHTRCVGMWQPGKTLSRLACLEAHAGKVEKTRPLDEWELVTLGLAAVDAGAFDRGLEYTRRGYAYSLAQNGPAHPRTLEMRGFLCKALFDYGDFDAALAECTEAVKAAEAQGDDNAFVVGKIRMFWGATLREAGRFAEAREQLDLAKDHADESELGDEIAQLELASGHAKDAIATLRKALAAAQKDLPPVHSNVISSKLSLAVALLDTGQVKEARAIIDDALASIEKAELSPLTIADVQFAAARIHLRSDKGARADAIALALKARDAYSANAPHTKRYDRARGKIDAWVADPK